MWTERRRALLVAALLVSATVAIFAYAYMRDPVRVLAVCDDEQAGAAQVECIFRVIERTLLSDGMSRAMALFSAAYDTYPSFVEQGCHKQAHRIGDIVYARLYRPSGGDIASLDFPQEVTACGYGFFHGFLEHIVQDNPDPDFVTETCTYLTEHLGDRMGDIMPICYHGSGHGFSLAHAETLPRSAWGNVREFTVQPAGECEELGYPNERALEECREGVFNILIEWAEQREYGFWLDEDRPFAACEISPVKLQKACYYEAAQKLDGMADHSPKTIEKMVSRIADPLLRKLSFQVGVAGVVQNTIYDEAASRKAYLECTTLSDEYFEMCLRSYINGLFEHGAPQEEYKRPLETCADAAVAQRGFSDMCYRTIIDRLERFYTDQKRAQICLQFPRSQQAACERTDG